MKVYNYITGEVYEEYKIGIDRCIVCRDVINREELETSYDRTVFRVFGTCADCTKLLQKGK